MTAKATTNTFVSRAREKFSDKYDYAMVEYINARTKVTIICPQHGGFLKTPDAHLRGGGCPQCSLASRSTKKTLCEHDVIVRLKEKGITLKGPYVGSRYKIDLMCQCGHQWSAKAGNVLNNRGCPACAELNRVEARKLAIDAINAVITPRGITLLGEYKNNNTPTKFQCTYGHIWSTSYKSIQSGNGCPYCSRKVRYTTKSAQEALDLKSIKLLTNISRATDRASFECERGHRWNAVVSVVVNKTACPECAKYNSGSSQRLTPEQIQETLDTTGFLMTGSYVNIAEPHEFTCQSGHKWMSNLNRIRTGDGCPYCYGNVALSIDDINRRLDHRGIRVGSDYVNTLSIATFECEKEHTWKSLPSNVLSGSGCPSCAEFGFNAEKPAEFYYARIYGAGNNPTLWMIGITNRTFEERYSKEDHQKMCLLYREKFEHGREAHEFEQQLKWSNSDSLYKKASPLKSKGGEGAISKEMFIEDILGVDVN